MVKPLQKRHVFQGQINVLFTVRGHRAFLQGIYPLKIVRDATSYYVDGFMFSPAFKKRKWDGKKHFFDLTTGTMPAGLVQIVVDALKEYDASAHVRVFDETALNCPAIGNKGFDLLGIDFGGGAFDYQLAAANAMVQARRGVLKIATNGGKTEVAIAVVKHLALPTLFLVDGLGLLYQTQKRFAKRLGVPLDSIGLIGDSRYSLGDWITVSTPDSLLGKLQLDAVKLMLQRWQVVIADECHHVAAANFYDVMNDIPAYYRFGLSGTPLDRSDGADLKLLASTGPVLYEVSNKVLVERGISVPPYVEIVKIQEPILPARGMSFQEVNKLGVIENNKLNAAAAARAVLHATKGKQVLILVEKIKQGKTITNLLKTHAPKLVTEYLTGKEKGDTREAALDRYRNGKINILVATTILDEGIDVPNIDVLILAAGGKAKIRLLQRVGRGLRTGAGKDRLLVIDFAIFCHPWLIRHSLARLKTYKQEECFMISAA